MSADLHDLTIAEGARLLGAKRLSPVEWTEALLARIEALDAQLDAFVAVTADAAMEQAKAATAEIAAGRYLGPMHGVPFGLKHIYDTAGIPTAAGSRVFLDRVPDRDATTTAKLLQAGGVLLGKLATHEFAQGGPNFDLPWPPARNPWNREHFTGGSSSGSGTAVAAGLLPGALGSDTGGSVRIPSALCGIAGLKPTYGLVSRHGVIPNSYTFDTCGPMARTVEDCAILLQAIAGHDPRDPSSAERLPPDYRAGLDGDIRGLRVGVLRHFWEEDLTADPEVAAAMEAALGVLSGLGAVLEDARMRPLQDYYDVKFVIGEPELYAVHENDLRERPGDFGADFLTKVLPACLLGATEYMQAQRQRRRILLEMTELYGRYDVLVTIGAATPAPQLDAYPMGTYWHPNVTTPFNVTGGPALVLGNGFSSDGLPLSLQIIGRPFEDATVLRVGHAYERATSWRDRRPELIEGLAPVPITPREPPRGMPDTDPETRTIVDGCVARAGLELTDERFAMLCRGAAAALAKAQRLRGSRPREEEPANVFRWANPAPG